jgi:hypothetical protein
MTLQTIKWDGKPISKPGMYSGISLEKYHSAEICDGPSISSSGLRKIFKKSPAHFFAEWVGNPKRVEPTPGRHFILGRAVHHLLLGEPGFAELFVVQPPDYEDQKTGEIKPWNNNATVCRAWGVKQTHAGKTILRREEIEIIRGMAERLSKNPLIIAGALNGLIERSIFWKDKETGIWLKSRPDTIPNHSGDFVDYKTTTSVVMPDLVRAIGEFGYHAQGGLVRAAAREVLDLKNTTFSLVFQEKASPFCERVVTLKDSDLDRGEKQNRAALRTFVRCLDSGHWPGPGGERGDAEPIELSERERTFIDDRLKYQLEN